MTTHKDNKNKENVVKKRKTNTSVISKSERAQLEKRRLAKKKAKRKAQRKRAIMSFIILIILLIAFSVIYALSFIFGLKTDNLGGGKAPGKNESLNILVVGMDVGDTAQEENKSLRRTDTMMLFNYNPITDAVNIVSIPRDTLIEVEDAYDAYGNYVPYWKMNAAYALGGEEELTNQVENLLEVEINYVVEIDYNAFRSIIDAIGGVEMYIDRDMYYDDYEQDLHIYFNEGETVLLDGEKAEEFIRWRQNNDGTGLADGDLGRIANQQKFMQELFKKLMNPLIIFDIPDVMNAVKSNVTTNMSGSEIIRYAFKIVKNSGISMHTLQGYDEDIYGQSFLVVDKSYNEEILDILHSGKIVSSIDRSGYNILVLNGTNTNGLAGNVRSDLENIGYVDISVDNGESTEKSTIICKDSELRELLKSDTGISKTSKDIGDYPGYDAVIILGENYN